MLGDLLGRALTRMQGGVRYPDKLERSIIEAIAYEIGGEPGKRLIEHLRRVNLIQRLDGGREVNFYTIEQGKVQLHQHLRLNDTEGESVFAMATFIGKDGMKNCCKLFTVDGRFFSLEFDNPTEHALGDRANDIHITYPGL